MRSRIVITSLVLFLFYCEQTPTTLDEEPFFDGTDENSFVVEVTTFEFDMLTWDIFFSVAASSAEDSIQVQAELSVSNNTVAVFSLNDMGLNDDIQLKDGSYDGIWTLPDEMSSSIDSPWTLNVTATSGGDTKTATHTMQPEISIPPVITEVVHKDSLMLPTSGLVIDTLSLHLTHSGRDEVKTVTLLSLKPDGNYANNGQPIQLYDDGGNDVFYTIEGIDFTSGDKTAGDGIYSLLLALTPSALSGEYLWTFNARTWAGVEANPLLDTLIVLPASSVARLDLGTTLAQRFLR